MKIKNLAIIFSIVGIMALGLYRLSVSSEEPVREIPKPTMIADTVKIDSFSENELILEMHDLKILAPNIVLAQAKLETGNFKSYLFQKSNNLFGFRNFNGYIKYESWKHSVAAYKNWQAKKYKGDTLYCYKLKQF
jgi:hypothetical protein